QSGPSLFAAVVLHIFALAEFGDLILARTLRQIGGARDKEESIQIVFSRSRRQVSQRQRIEVAQVGRIRLHRGAQKLLGLGIVLGLIGGNARRAIEDHGRLRFQLLEIRIRRAIGLGHGLQTLQAFFTALAGFGKVLLRVLVRFRQRPLGVGQQCQRPDIARVGLQNLLRRVQRLGLVVRLLVSAHQKFQRVFLHHAVRILGQKRFQAANLGRRILLLHGAHVGVVLGWVFDLFFLGSRWRRRGVLLRRGLSWRGSGLSDGGNRGYQQHRENNLLH